MKNLLKKSFALLFLFTLLCCGRCKCRQRNVARSQVKPKASNTIPNKDNKEAKAAPKATVDKDKEAEAVPESTVDNDLNRDQEASQEAKDVSVSKEEKPKKELSAKEKEKEEIQYIENIKNSFEGAYRKVMCKKNEWLKANPAFSEISDSLDGTLDGKEKRLDKEVEKANRLKNLDARLDTLEEERKEKDTWLVTFGIRRAKDELKKVEAKIANLQQLKNNPDQIAKLLEEQKQIFSDFEELVKIQKVLEDLEKKKNPDQLEATKGAES